MLWLVGTEDVQRMYFEVLAIHTQCCLFLSELVCPVLCLSQAFHPTQILGVQEEVQLREQDFGNFQDTDGKKREKAERLRFGRFFYRFPNGESGADVYDRITIFGKSQ
jgi:broad specificity phosphatase PhoE